MRKKIAIILECVPIVAAPLAIALTLSNFSSSFVGVIIAAAVLLAFNGVVFYVVGRVLCKGDRLVLVLGILDILATVLIIGFYALAIATVAM